MGGIPGAAHAPRRAAHPHVAYDRSVLQVGRQAARSRARPAARHRPSDGRLAADPPGGSSRLRDRRDASGAPHVGRTGRRVPARRHAVGRARRHAVGRARRRETCASLLAGRRGPGTGDERPARGWCRGCPVRGECRGCPLRGECRRCRGGRLCRARGRLRETHFWTCVPARPPGGAVSPTHRWQTCHHERRRHAERQHAVRRHEGRRRAERRFDDPALPPGVVSLRDPAGRRRIGALRECRGQGRRRLAHRAKKRAIPTCCRPLPTRTIAPARSPCGSPRRRKDVDGARGRRRLQQGGSMWHPQSTASGISRQWTRRPA